VNIRPVLLGVFLLAGCVYAPAAEVVPATAASDPVCGFVTGPHFYFEASQVRQGLVVELQSQPARAHEPVTLRFFVRQKPRDFAVDRLQIEHEKFMHVIGMRDDLKEFFHVHPVRVAPGVWEVSHTFNRGGNYKIWSDLKYRGVSYSFGHPLLAVAGSPGEIEKASVPTEHASSGGYEIHLTHLEPLGCGRTNQLQLSVCDAAGRSTPLENFLGAPMHLVLVREDLSLYLHAHPVRSLAPAEAIQFRQNFPAQGLYKLFAQFRPKEANLPPDESILAEFLVKVDAPGD